MAKDHKYEYDETASGNTVAGGINIEGSSPVDNFDNALRELMAQRKKEANAEGGAFTAGGSADALTVADADNISVTAYVAGMNFKFAALSDNATTSPTLSFGGGPSSAIKKAVSGAEADLKVKDIKAGAMCEVVWRPGWASGGGAWQLINPEARDVTTLNGGSFSGFRNKLPNPLFQIDIEGNASGATGQLSYCVEGWQMVFSNDVTTQTLERISGDSVPYALRYQATTGSDASLAAGQFAQLRCAVEGYDFADAQWGTADAKSVWMSGRVKAPTTGVYCVSFRNAAFNRTYVFEINCIANTWVDFEKEIPGDTAGTWEKGGLSGVCVTFAVAAGTNFQTNADQWIGNSAFATVNQENGLATNGNNFDVEALRVSLGGPIPVEYKSFADEMSKMSRYYYKDQTTRLVDAYTNTPSAFHNVFINFPSVMRGTPVLGSAWSGQTNVSSTTATAASSYGCLAQITATAAGRFYANLDLITANARIL